VLPDPVLLFPLGVELLLRGFGVTFGDVVGPCSIDYKTAKRL
jgi:hypothetical protein